MREKITLDQIQRLQNKLDILERAKISAFKYQKRTHNWITDAEIEFGQQCQSFLRELNVFLDQINVEVTTEFTDKFKEYNKSDGGFGNHGDFDLEGYRFKGSTAFTLISTTFLKESNKIKNKLCQKRSC